MLRTILPVCFVLPGLLYAVNMVGYPSATDWSPLVLQNLQLGLETDCCAFGVKRSDRSIDPLSAILAAKNGKERGAERGQEGSSGSNASQGGDEGGAGQASGQPNGERQDHRDQQEDDPPKVPEQEVRSDSLGASDFYLLEVGENRFRLPESAVVEERRSDEVQVTRVSDGAMLKLVDIEQDFSLSDSIRHSGVAESMDVKDYLFRYGTCESLQSFHRRHPEGYPLPEEELQMAGRTVIVALHSRTDIVGRMVAAGMGAPLELSVGLGLVCSTRYLLDKGHRVDAFYDNGNTALHIAVLRKDLPMVRLLLKYRPDPNILSCVEGVSPFHMAVANGQVEIARLLKGAGADRSFPTVAGKMPWQMVTDTMASSHEIREEMIRLTEIQCPDCPEHFERFITAIKDGNEQEVLNYVKNAPDPLMQFDGQSPLHLAVEQGNPDIVRHLFLYAQQSSEVAEGSSHYELLNGLRLSDGAAALHVAISRLAEEPVSSNSRRACNYLKIINILLDQGARLDVQRRSDGATPVYLAARHGLVDVVSLFKQKEANLNLGRRLDLGTPLHVAAEYGHTNVVRQLVSGKADVNVRLGQSCGALTPLELAITRGHHEITKLLAAKSDFIFDSIVKGDVQLVRALLASGVSADTERKGRYTLLHVAAESGQIEIVRLLIGGLATVDKTYSHGNTPLHLAAKAGHSETVALLLASGSKAYGDCNNRYSTPLELALYNHHPGVARQLLEHEKGLSLFQAVERSNVYYIKLFLREGVSTTITHPANGDTPLHLALRLRRKECAELLMDDEIVNQQNNSGETPLSIFLDSGLHVLTKLFSSHLLSALVNSIEKDDLKLFSAILQVHEDWNQRDDRSGEFPLHLAARMGKKHLITAMLEHGAETMINNDSGLTPAEEALCSGHRSTLNILLDADGGRLWFMAVGNHDRCMVRDLLSAGVAVDRKDRENGETALHKAARFGDREIVDLLLNHGASRTVKNNQQKTPRQLAQESGKFYLDEKLHVERKCILL